MIFIFKTTNVILLNKIRHYYSIIYSLHKLIIMVSSIILILFSLLINAYYYINF